MLAPVLAREIARRGKQVIAIAVADTQSELDTTNTKKTLQTLELITTNNNIYLPTMIFDNRVGRSVVDRAVVHRLAQLLRLLCAPAIEVDRNDRKNWLNAMKTSGASAGIRLLHVAAGEEPDESTQSGEIWNYGTDAVYDAVLSIGSIIDVGKEAKFCQTGDLLKRVVYTGTFTQIKQTPHVGLVASDNQAVATLIKQIDDIQARFATQKSAASAIRVDGAQASSGDLIL